MDGRATEPGTKSSSATEAANHEWDRGARNNGEGPRIHVRGRMRRAKTTGSEGDVVVSSGSSIADDSGRAANEEDVIQWARNATRALSLLRYRVGALLAGGLAIMGGVSTLGSGSAFADSPVGSIALIGGLLMTGVFTGRMLALRMAPMSVGLAKNVLHLRYAAGSAVVAKASIGSIEWHRNKALGDYLLVRLTSGGQSIAGTLDPEIAKWVLDWFRPADELPSSRPGSVRIRSD
jgi:hypothetical protein